MSRKSSRSPSRQQLLAEIEYLRARLAEAEPAGPATRAGDAAPRGVSGRRRRPRAAGAEAPRAARDRPKTPVRKRAAALQKALDLVQAERQRFHDVLETLPVYLVLLTPDHHVPFANRFFRERFGESRGRRCFEYLFHRTAPCEVCETYKVLDTMTPREWEWTGPDGRNYYIYDFPFTDTDGAPLIMEVGLDITERQRAEKALQEAQQTLERHVAERTEALRAANERLQAQAEELQSVNEQRNAQAEELSAQAEELSAQAQELRETNEALRASEERLAYLASFPERDPTPVLEVGLDGGVRYANPAAERLFPDLRQQGIAHPWLADWAAIVRSFRRGRASTALRDLTIGDRTYQQALHYFAQECFIRIYAFDITERNQVEETLHKSEERFRVAQELSLDAFTILDAVRDADGTIVDFRWTFVNPEAGRLLRHPPEQLVGRRLLEVLPGNKTGSDLFERYVRVVETGQPHDYELCYEAEDIRGWFRNMAVKLGDGVAICFSDITERKQMEQQLRQLNDRLGEEVEAQTETLHHTIDRLQDEVVRRVLAEGKLRRRSQMLEGFFQHTIGPLAFLDQQFHFVRVNEAYARAVGRNARSLVGQSYFALHPDPEDEAIFRQVLQSRQPYRGYAWPFHCAGEPRAATYWDRQLTPLLDERGQVQFLVLSLENVTERQKAFQELEQRARQLQKLTLELSQAEDRERRRLAEILHDDLQQQLAAAKFHLGILSGRVRNDETAQELAGQVNQMLKEAIAKSRSLSHELSPAVLYQGDLGETFEWLARQMEAEHGLIVHVEVRGQVNCPADALKALLYRSAQELLFNVVKHARVKEARLRLQRVRGRLWLTVSDQGPGFELPTLGRTAGFGLLGIRERVELLGGRMKIRSVKGRGSTFLIAVPEVAAPAGAPASGVSAPSPAAPGRPQPPAETPPEQRLRVLLVDDHEVMREGLAALLAEQTDLEVVGQAGNGQEAVDLARELRPDVAIMDVAMPVLAGDEATRQIKLHLPGIRVVALSMFDGPEMAERMRRSGATAYLLKTGPVEDLLAAIRGRPGP